jgi:hypothetical protein
MKDICLIMFYWRSCLHVLKIDHFTSPVVYFGSTLLCSLGKSAEVLKLSHQQGSNGKKTRFCWRRTLSDKFK